MSIIQIPSAIVSAMMQAAEVAYPNECCGLLIGQNIQDNSFIISETASSPNIARGDHRNSFEVDPQVRFNVLHKLSGGKKRIIGHYHSHPDHGSKPSERDFKMALEPEMVWLIVAVENGLAQRPKAHIVDLVKKGFREIKIDEFN